MSEKLLLLDQKRERLCYVNRHLIEIEFTGKDHMAVCEVETLGRIQRVVIGEMALHELGVKYIGIGDSSEISRYLILPIMEIERVFNSVRLKWLEAILKGKRSTSKYINANYNNLFKALAGFPLRNDPGNKQAMKIIANEGFNIKEMPIIDLRKEKQEMGIILKYLFNIFSEDLGRLYKSLLSIKPAFHEWYMDLHYFDFAHQEGLEDSSKDDRRTRVLQEIHGLRRPQKVKDLDTIAWEIRVPNFLTYAPCAIVEGPATYRRRLDVSYYEQIRKRRTNLHNNFLIYDYWGRDLTKEDLKILERFQYDNCIDLQTP